MAERPSPQPPPTTPAYPRTDLRRPTTFFWWVPFTLAAIAGLLTYAIVASQDNVYRARSEFIVPPSSPIAPEDYTQLARSEILLSTIIRELHLDTTADALRNDVRARTDGTLIAIEADAPSPALAQLLAIGISNAVVHSAPLSLDAPAPTQLGQVAVPRDPLPNNAPLYTASAVAAALVIGLIGASVLASRERPLQPADDVQWLASLPTLGSIPSSRNQDSPTLLSQPHSPEATALRDLQTTIEGLRTAESLRAILVAGVDAQADADSIAVNLALAFAETGRRLLLIDANLHQPSVHRLLQLPNQHGLTDARFSNLIPPAQEIPGVPLRVITSGVLPPHPSELLATPRFATLLAELPRSAELAILDAPDLVESNAAVVLASACDAILLVADASRTHPEELRVADQALRAAGKPILGVVWSNAPRPADEPTSNPASSAARASPAPANISSHHTRSS